MYSRGRTLAEPAFRQERLWGVEVARIAMDAVSVKEELCLLGDHPTRGSRQIRQNLLDGDKSLYLQVS